MSEVDIPGVCARYVELVGDENVDAMMELFADDATVEDPVGAEVRSGREELRAFYATIPPTGAKAKMSGEIHCVGNHAAFPFIIDTDGFEMSVIDTMSFNDEGKITSMRAYWRLT